MKPEAQRIAIAEACPDVAYVHHGIPRWNKYGSANQVVFDPLSDLNAMHEAEKVLTTLQQQGYIANLIQVCDPKDDIDEPTRWLVCHATAAQRAEAFLRTIGKWVESEKPSSHVQGAVDSDTAPQLTPKP